MSVVIDHIQYVSETVNGILFCGGPNHDFDSIAQGGIEGSRCYAIEDVIRNNLDAKWIIHQGRPRQVVLDVIAENPHTVTSVWIDAIPLAGEVYKMRVVHTRDVGGETYLQCGVWMPGEGRRSIRANVVQAMAQCIDPRDIGSPDKIYTRCPNPAHGLYHDRKMKSNIVPESDYKAICLFNMIFEKMCTVCLEEIQAPAADDFGLPLEASNWDNA